MVTLNRDESLRPQVFVKTATIVLCQMTCNLGMMYIGSDGGIYICAISLLSTLDLIAQSARGRAMPAMPSLAPMCCPHYLRHQFHDTPFLGIHFCHVRHSLLEVHKKPKTSGDYYLRFEGRKWLTLQNFGGDSAVDSPR
jgi:hypothetical protein